MKTMTILGTRPEAIKMAPVLRALDETPRLTSVLCRTGQHRELLDQALATFELRADHDLDLMRESQSPVDVLARSLPELDRIVREEKPDIVIVQGDTTSALAGALVSFHCGIPVAHVEAGLRSGNPALPFPEEANRRMIAALTAIHLAPTKSAEENLIAEGVPREAIYVTGNPVVDSLQFILRSRPPSESFVAPSSGRRTYVVTLHRRETLGERLEGIGGALARVAERHAEQLSLVLPLHRNPRAHAPLRNQLSEMPNVTLLDPLPYVDFVHLMARAEGVITDSGGVQEEATALGKAVLVARDVTERPEVLDQAGGTLLGTDPTRFERGLEAFLARGIPSSEAGQHSVFGDGKAGPRIVQHLLHFLRGEGRVADHAA